MKISIIGAGGWGTAIACMAGQRQPAVTLWARNELMARELAGARENLRYLPGVRLPESVAVTADMAATVQGADMVIIATPSHAVRETAARLAGVIGPECIVVSAAKGLEVGSLKRMSEVIAEEIPFVADTVVAISGPNHAEEVGRRQPSAAVAASCSRYAAETVQEALMLPYFRVYTNPDIIGVELGGALKNIIALGAGIADGLGFGDNAKAAFMTRGLAEIARLGVAMLAKPSTFAGLSGVGDLIATCTSRHSRNRRAGALLAEGKCLREVESANGMVVEGIRSALAAHELAGRHNVEMPITEQIYRVLYQATSPKEAVTELLSRGRTHEVEEVADIIHWR
ncbi:MAG: NAD(P)H-dependent glycerol-3-phosphate dehydrogenase [Negativicutes bacterium]|nr:NAD(P)H-dependent glycerol-3-phosphate dehydrogenase [Negativicutes bacterium]